MFSLEEFSTLLSINVPCSPFPPVQLTDQIKVSELWVALSELIIWTPEIGSSKVWVNEVVSPVERVPVSQFFLIELEFNVVVVDEKSPNVFDNEELILFPSRFIKLTADELPEIDNPAEVVYPHSSVSKIPSLSSSKSHTSGIPSLSESVEELWFKVTSEEVVTHTKSGWLTSNWNIFPSTCNASAAGIVKFLVAAVGYVVVLIAV